MSQLPRSERETQERVIKLFSDVSHPDCLEYEFLGNWHQRENNRCIEVDLLRINLLKRGYSEAHISAALQKLESAADTTGIGLYKANMSTYNLIRYPVKVQLGVGKAFEDVDLIDWESPGLNDFAIAEEVTLKSGLERRPDLVLYINGLAVGVLELKRSSVDIADGIRQLITNQEKIFNESFFSTVQFVFAGNDSQGLHYGTTGTPEKFFLTWNEKSEESEQTKFRLDEDLRRMCEKSRLLDLIRNSVIFDEGVKKVPRVHQYFGFKKAQERIKAREGGVIWHTQGSGKSILMVLLAKWILEHDPDGRVLIITDRDELDKQIEGVMRNAGVVGEDAPSPRITSRQDFVTRLSDTSRRLLCALVHKFDLDLKADPPPINGRFYVFVDECHRTQGGGMNKQMKRWLSDGIFVGFTGTPLLKKDRQTTREVFGTYIHTYKFNQAVSDRVVLDLKYEARAVPQRLMSKEAIDEWFERKTKTLNSYKQAVLRSEWATMEQLMSADERKRRIVGSIAHDFDVKPRLVSNRGTAILVAASIYDACHYYRLFQTTPLGKSCGLVTSYQPNSNTISREPFQSDERYKFDTYTDFVLTDHKTTKAYEDRIKEQFVKEPANCKLLIVVSKLLTGFDAPSCTYIYLDNKLQDHNLFQAICRTNRLDGHDKEYGHIVDFKELFHEVRNSIAVYTSDELDTDDGDGDGNPIVKDWIEEGRRRLDEAREALSYLCEPVPAPHEIEQYLFYFCGNASDPGGLDSSEQLRINFYKAVVAFVRAYASISQDLPEAGYSDTEIEVLSAEVATFTDIRNAIKKHAGEEFDVKPYEADMRHLMNTYVQASMPETLGQLSELSLTELIIETGVHDAIAKKLNVSGKLSNNAVAEGIINNIRKTIIREQLTNPSFYKEMSQLLDDLIERKRDDTESYKEFLNGAEVLAKKLASKGLEEEYPPILSGHPEAIVLFNNLGDLLASGGNEIREPSSSEIEDRANLALQIDRVMREKAPADFRGDEARERRILNELHPLMDRDKEATMAIFEIIKQQPGY